MGSSNPPPTPKAIIHKKYAQQAVYRTEEVTDAGENPCPGLVVQRQTRIQYRCVLELPDLTVSSGRFSKKKDAEQAAAQIAVEKLGLQENEKNLTPEEAFDELIKRLNILFTDEFLTSLHPFVGHLKSSLKRNSTAHFSPVPISSIPTCDTKINNLCKTLNPNCETDLLSTLSLVSKAVRASDSLSSSDTGFQVWNVNPFRNETVEPLLSCQADASESVRVLEIPAELEERVKDLRVDLRNDVYYLDEIAKVLGVDDPSHILISRNIGKASSEMRFHFAAPQFLLSSSLDEYECGTDSDVVVNKRASYLSGQTIYGNAILANVGYTWRAGGLFCEDVTTCTYYRMLLSKLPDGPHKLALSSPLLSSLPSSYSRATWRGPPPRDLLSGFCRIHRLPEPTFSLQKKEEGDLQCEVRVLGRKEGESLVVGGFGEVFRRESEAVQGTALRVLNWFRGFWGEMDETVGNSSEIGIESVENLRICPRTVLEEFSTWKSLYSKVFFDVGTEKGDEITRNGIGGFGVEGNDSGVFPSVGSLVGVNYEIYLVKEGDSNLRCLVERNEEFEFEIGTGSVIPQVESCITQISVDQSAKFTSKLPSRDLVLAACDVSHLSLDGCILEYNVKLIRVTEPMEERMEKAFFTPPLSKQRVLFAVEQINQSNAFSLVDFGCGSGSLLDSLLDHNTCLKQIVGVDISVRALTRAAKVLHQKLSKNCAMQACLKSAVLYDGSITDFDARLYKFDIATCIEVIEHMEEDQAHLFGDMVLSLFSPKILIVSTPNYEYNPILQRSNKDEESEEKEKENENKPCKFRNFDHKFEWTRAQFEIWANNLASKHNYSVEFSGVGGSGEIEPGFASQIAVFRRNLNELRELQGNELRGLESGKKYEVVWEWEGNDKKCD
ncbi:hypothetical protein LUZ60_017367 [Juncus effusus]|nr:hypothetical protein LUZ60_017367 [Juncus effusus]